MLVVDCWMEKLQGLHLIGKAIVHVFMNVYQLGWSIVLLTFFSFSFFFGGGLVGRSAAQMSLLRFGAAAKLVRTDLYTLLFGQVFYYSLLDVGMSGHYALLPCSKNKFIFYPFHVYLI